LDDDTKAFENISRIRDDGTDAVHGTVVWSPVRSLFLCAMYTGAIVGIWRYLRIDTVVLFAVKTVAVLLLGHSVGMHRRLIHKSFSCPLWLEHVLVYTGTLVGLGGPFAMIRTHDFRDWAQRQPVCHDYFAHRRPTLVDALWQMHCDLRLAHPPRLDIEPEVRNDRFYRLIDRHWIAVHLPWAVGFFLMGGWGFVLWGVCAQVAVTVTGHWLIGHLAHSDHAHDWQVEGAGVQGRNVDFAGLITMGESWHNNHHAFPGSARIGLYKGQSDPGYGFLKALEALGLVWDIRLPRHLAHRPNLQWIGKDTPSPMPERRPCRVMTGLRQRLRT
jgi:stearoyl-CoA desaturase (delta-9 desaturase)